MKTTFLLNERIQQLIISLVIVVNTRLPCKLVQYGGFSPRAMIDAISSGFQEKKLHHLFYGEVLLDFKASHLSPFFCFVRLKFGNCEEQTMSESRYNKDLL